MSPMAAAGAVDPPSRRHAWRLVRVRSAKSHTIRPLLCCMPASALRVPRTRSLYVAEQSMDAMAILAGCNGRYTFGIGGAGSGAPFHAHEAAVNVVIVGTKRWFLYPPAQADYTTEPIFDWLRDTYPTLPPDRRPIELLQQAGDVVILPPLWGHATIVSPVSLSRR